LKKTNLGLDRAVTNSGITVKTVLPTSAEWSETLIRASEREEGWREGGGRVCETVDSALLKDKFSILHLNPCFKIALFGVFTDMLTQKSQKP